MTASEHAAKQAMRAALNDLRNAHQAALAAINMLDEVTETQTALDLARDLVRALADMGEVTYEIRNRLAGRIYETEQPSLAELAKRAGVSKGRADQIIRLLKKRAAAQH